MNAREAVSELTSVPDVLGCIGALLLVSGFFGRSQALLRGIVIAASILFRAYAVTLPL